jgi:hypothetical protein
MRFGLANERILYTYVGREVWCVWDSAGLKTADCYNYRNWGSGGVIVSVYTYLYRCQSMDA